MTSERKTRILLVHRDAGAGLRLVVQLRRRGFDCIVCNHVDDVDPLEQTYDVIVSDLTAASLTDNAALSPAVRLPGIPEIIIAPIDAEPHRIRAAYRRGIFDVVPTGNLDRLCEALSASIHYVESVPKTQEIVRLGQSENTGVAWDPDTGLLTRSSFLESLSKLRLNARATGSHVGIIALLVQEASSTNTAATEIGRTLSRHLGEESPIVRYNAGRYLAGVLLQHSESIHESATTIKNNLCDSTHDRHSRQVFAGIAVSGIGCEELESDLVTRALDALDSAANSIAADIVTWSDIAPASPSRRKLAGASPEQVALWIDRSRQHIKRSYVESVLTLVEAVEAKEPGAFGHARQVSHYAELIASGMGFGGAKLDSIRTAALLHDIGKIGVPDAILRKPGPLDSEEYAIIKRHPETAIQILTHNSFLGEELQWILHHHERFDGTGYPHRLAGTDIPMGARILTVADAVDAMRSVRNYKAGEDVERIRQELLRGSGGQFDPDVVRVALQTILSDRGALLV